MCPAGHTTYRNLQADNNNNCGACGRVCRSGQACAAGVYVGEGSLRFTMTWDRNGDMDLHVLPPCGTEIYYGRVTACNVRLDRDDTVARGPENIFWTAATPFATGRYYNGVTIRTMTGNRGGVTDGNRACGAGFSTFFIDL